MYTVAIGQSFLKLYNAKTGANLSAKAFFDEVMWPLFFNSADDKHLMLVPHSPFFAFGFIKQAAKEGLPIELYRKQRFEASIVGAKEMRDYHVAIIPGGWASGPDQSTFGQVSDVKHVFDSEAVYSAWVGAALSLGFGGGYDFMIDDPLILWHTYLGWKYYRRYMNETPSLKGRQMAAWNGLWLTFGPLGEENAEKVWGAVRNKLSDHINQKGIPWSLERPDWPEQVFALCRSQLLKSRKTVLAQAFSFGQMNKTLGVVPIAVPEVRSLGEVWEYLLDLNSELYSDQQAMLIEDNIETKYSMERAVQTGGLGLRALAPKEVELLFNSNRNRKAETSNLEELEKFALKKHKAFFYNLTWILAMAQTTLPNDDELLRRAEAFALELKDYHDRGADRASTANEKQNKIEDLLGASNKTLFLNKALADIIEDYYYYDEEPPEVYNHIKRMVALLPMEHYRLFIAVLRCSYVYCKVGGKLTTHF